MTSAQTIERSASAASTLRARTRRRLGVGVAFAVLATAVIPLTAANAQVAGQFFVVGGQSPIVEQRADNVYNFLKFVPADGFALEEVQIFTTGNLVFRGGERFFRGKEIGLTNIFPGSFENGADATIQANAVVINLRTGTRTVVPSPVVVIKIKPLFDPTTTVATTTKPPAAPSPTVIVTPPPSAPPSPAPAGVANRPPVAQPVQVIVAAGNTTGFTLKATDPDGNAIAYSVSQLPNSGKLSGQAPNLGYTPNAGFLGTDSLTFTASDGTASSAAATVTITVTGSNAPPASTESAATKAKPKVKKKTTKKKAKR